MEREWLLDDDVSREDSLLDGFTFEQLITAVRCNCKKVTPAAVMAQVYDMMDIQRQDMMFLLEKNMDRIIAAATEGRE